MGDPRIDRMLDSLETEFEAGSARRDDEAADDLALSFRQDSPLRMVLSAGGWRLDPSFILPATGRIEELGNDFALVQGTVFALDKIGFIEAPVDPPITSNRTFLQVLRGWTRPPSVVDLKAGDREFRGRLIRASVDHIGLATSAGERLISLRQITWVRPLR